MDNKIIARNICNEWGKFASIINDANKNYKSVCDIENILRENGYEVVGKAYCGTAYATKNGIQFSVSKYSASTTLSKDYGFHIGSNGFEHGKYFRISNIANDIDGIVEAGYELPKDHYTRTPETEDMISAIREEIRKTMEIVNRGGYGELGGRMRSNGYFVEYDGGSVCTFSKDYICYHAYCEYGKGWRLEDHYNCYINGTDDLSEEFSLSGENKMKLDECFEAIFGNFTGLGRRVSEKERVNEYKSFIVRSYGSKTLDTIERFDNFEDAKKYAHDKAVEFAKDVSGDLKRYAHVNPIDVSDKYDYLAAYIWYVYDRGSEHVIFVQGEK